MPQTITDEQLAQRSELAGPVLEAISFAEAHIARLREEMRDQQAMIEELVWALHLWANEDATMTLHPDAERVFFAALEMAGVPHNQAANAAGYWLDLDWCERQRVVWQRRNDG